MNFLGHFYLAHPDPQLIAGNLLGEFVHGRSDRDSYPEGIWKGIMMHRQIDSTTDAHPQSKAIAEYYRRDFGRYAPVLSDIALDYFIANDKNRFVDRASLESFSQDIYAALKRYRSLFETKGKQMIDAMTHEDWLTQYMTANGICKSFNSLIMRASYLESKPTADMAFQILEKNYSAMLPHYQKLISDLEAEF